eukprot:scaffold116650_cov38-Cyclotella_meneghiniana.AAC.2
METGRALTEENSWAYWQYTCSCPDWRAFMVLRVDIVHKLRVTASAACSSRKKSVRRSPLVLKMLHSSGFISSGKNMRRWFGSEHSQCPNCGKEDEDAQHLMHCPDPGGSHYFGKRCRNSPCG